VDSGVRRAGIEAAREAGLGQSIKINMVVAAPTSMKLPMASASRAPALCCALLSIDWRHQWLAHERGHAFAEVVQLIHAELVQL
jgi:hypothetical protein